MKQMETQERNAAEQKQSSLDGASRQKEVRLASLGRERLALNNLIVPYVRSRRRSRRSTSEP